MDSRKRKYLRVIAHNSGGPQPVMPRDTSIHLIVSGSLTTSNPGVVIQNIRSDAFDDGYIVTWDCEDGDSRTALTPSGFSQLQKQRLYRQCDVADIEDVIKTEAQQDEPNKDVIGWGNQWLDRLQ